MWVALNKQKKHQTAPHITQGLAHGNRALWELKDLLSRCECKHLMRSSSWRSANGLDRGATAAQLGGGARIQPVPRGGRLNLHAEEKCDVQE